MASTMRAPTSSRCPPNSTRPTAGFTLLELVVVLAIGAVLAAVAVPPMHAMLNTQKVVSFVNLFVSSLHLARNEAIKRNARAVMCKSATGQSCTGSGGWEQGWILFHDTNNNAQLDAGEQVVLRQGAVSVGPRLTGNTPVANYVSYSASGGAKLVSGAFQAGTFTLCPESVPDTGVRLIVLSGTGRPRTQAGTPGDCR